MCGYTRSLLVTSAAHVACKSCKTARNLVVCHPGAGSQLLARNAFCAFLGPFQTSYNDRQKVKVPELLNYAAHSPRDIRIRMQEESCGMKHARWTMRYGGW